MTRAERTIGFKQILWIVDIDAATMLMGLVVLPIIGLSLLLVGWNGGDEPIYTILGFAVLIVAIIIAATNRKLKTRPWKDWFPF